MSVLLHIADTHFGTERRSVVEALVALAAQQRPDLVVLAGDVTRSIDHLTSADVRGSPEWKVTPGWSVKV